MSESTSSRRFSMISSVRPSRLSTRTGPPSGPTVVRNRRNRQHLRSASTTRAIRRALLQTARLETQSVGEIVAALRASHQIHQQALATGPQRFGVKGQAIGNSAIVVSVLNSTRVTFDFGSRTRIASTRHLTLPTTLRVPRVSESFNGLRKRMDWCVPEHPRRCVCARSC
jgi:hypothetical protein